MRYWILALGLLGSLAACAKDETTAAPAVEKFIENKHYTKLLAPVPTIVEGDSVEISEVFRFGCPACFRFEAAVKEWKKTKTAYIKLI